MSARWTYAKVRRAMLSPVDGGELGEAPPERRSPRAVARCVRPALVCGGLLVCAVTGWVSNDVYRDWSNVGAITEDEVRAAAVEAYWEARGIEPGSELRVVELYFGGVGCGGVVRIRHEVDGEVDEATVVVPQDSGAPVGVRLAEGSVAEEAEAMRSADSTCS